MQPAQVTSATPAPPIVGPQPTPAPTIFAPEDAVFDQRPLIVWVPDAFMDFTVRDDDLPIAETVRQFEQTHPQLRVELVVKADEGDASLFNFLQTANRVAPAILPDMILFDTRQLWQIVELGLLQPLPMEQLTNSDGFFPFAMQAVTVDEQQYAAPYFADMLHLIYRQNQVPTPPPTWQALLDTEQRFVFPGAGQSGVSDLWLLTLYLSAGGQIHETVTEADRQALEAMLMFLSEGKARGVIPAQVTTFTGPAAIWSAITNEEFEMASMSAHGFLHYNVSMEDFGFAALPGPTGSAPPLAQVWAFAVLANEEQRRLLAMALLDSFLSPVTQSQWSITTHHLPTREDAWRVNTPYTQFLDQQLREALALPATQLTADFVRRLHQAQNSILTGEQTLQQLVAEF